MEQAGLGQLCVLKKRYAAAARFYADAFTTLPKLADDPQNGRRRAAAAAALAADGQGEDAGKLEDKERARLRKQAWDWLWADLAAQRNLVRNSTPSVLERVQANLRRWQEDPDLAAVRDAASLEKLSPEERADWKKLWAEVDRIVTKSGANEMK